MKKGLFLCCCAMCSLLLQAQTGRNMSVEQYVPGITPESFGCKGDSMVDDSGKWSFLTLANQSWPQLLEEKPFRYAPPRTINLQIQPVHSPSWVYVNPSMAVSRRYVPTDLTNDAEKIKAAQTQDDMLLQFAFDDPAYLPDFNLTKLSLKDNRYPVASADYYANDVYYHITYAVAALDEEQHALCVHISVKNESASEKVAHVRAKLGYYPENEIFDYHYIPFYWDNTKWRPYDKISLRGTDIYKEDKRIGRVISGDMQVEWERSKTYADKDYEEVLYPQVWFGSGYVLPPYRLKSMQDVIHAHKSVKPNETASFSIKLLVDDAQATERHFARLASLSPARLEQAALDAYAKELSGDVAQLDFNKNHWPDIFSVMQLSIKQMLIKYPGKSSYQPAQGGSSERFYVWVFEAVHMLRAMLRTGQFDDVKRGLDFIFSLQDAGCPPVGKFTTTAGAVGTTGPRWANTTGMALVLACEYYLYSRDEAFIEQFLPKILKAVRWIEGEVKATRKLNADGSRPSTYGLMPWAVGCDADTGYCLSDTDVFTFWGFAKAVDFLEYIGHPEAATLRNQLEMYRRDLLAAIDLLKRPDGYIGRIVQEEGVKQDIQPKFEITDSMTPIALVGIMDPRADTFRKFMDFFENHYTDGEFMGGLDREIMYTNQCEHYWQQVYLKLGEWKKAFILVQTCLRYGMSQDTYQTAERFSKRNPAFAPWQPNGSANGRIIDMMLNSFYYENSADFITLLGAMPFEWLIETGHSSVRNLYTLTGKVTMNVDRITDDACAVKLVSDGYLPAHIRIPAHLNAKSESDGVKQMTAETFVLSGKMKEVSFVVRK